MSAPSPRRRVIRTVKQVLVAVPTAWAAITVPLAAAGADVPPVLTAAIAGVCGALVILVSAAQNAWDEREGNG